MDEKALEAAINAWFEMDAGFLSRDPDFQRRMQAAIAAYLEASGTQKDAERYRWLRDACDDVHAVFWEYKPTYYGHDDVRRSPRDVDAAIDEARK